MRLIGNLILLVSLSGSVTAQDAVVKAVGTPAKPSPKVPEVVRLGERVRVTVSDYKKLRTDAAGKPVTLFLNGLDSGIPASAEYPDENQLEFILTRTAENLALWRVLLRDPFRRDFETVTVSVGVNGGRPLAREPNGMTNVKLLKKRWSALAGIGWIIFLLLVAAGLLYFARTMLKNDHNDRYSLGRTQLAFWFILILVSYLLIWMLTFDRDTLTGSVLVLLGISAATTMAAGVINSTVQERRAEKVAALTMQAGAVPAAAAPLMAEAATVTTAMTAPARSRFFYDLISDDNGRPALHRYQIVVWTIVLGVFFVYSVVVELTMPQFSDTLLALMGISAGTYIGVKAPATG